MKKYISIIELGEDSTDFAYIIGIRGFYENRYVCESINDEGERIHQQTFTLPKSIDGLPANDKALKNDVLNSWKAEQDKIRQAQGLEKEES